MKRFSYFLTLFAALVFITTKGYAVCDLSVRAIVSPTDSTTKTYSVTDSLQFKAVFRNASATFGGSALATDIITRFKAVVRVYKMNASKLADTLASNLVFTSDTIDSYNFDPSLQLTTTSDSLTYACANKFCPNATGYFHVVVYAWIVSSNTSELTTALYQNNNWYPIHPYTSANVSNPYWFKTWYKNDLQVTNVLSPISKLKQTYPYGVAIPVEVVYTNLGADTLSHFRSIVNIADSATNKIVYSDTLITDSTYPGLKMGTKVPLDRISNINFDPYQLGLPQGVYTISVISNIINDRDFDESNNIFPTLANANRIDATVTPNVPYYDFRIQYSKDAKADTILMPGDSMILNSGRPVVPKALFRNYGMNAIPVATCLIQIYNSANVLQWQQTQSTDINKGSDEYNKVMVNFNQYEYTPTVPGRYKVVTTVTALEDIYNTANNTRTQVFFVQGGLSGGYTIGVNGDFATIQKAVDALYQRGVAGPVTFSLIDSVYNEGSITDAYKPAIDLTSKIMGVSSTNTITFKPATALAGTKGKIKITLNTASGYGIAFGQWYNSSNSYSVFNNTLTKKKYANSDGYITFDGGDYKSLKFIVNSAVDFSSAFYLREGSSHISIKNCVISNASTNPKTYSLPQVVSVPPSLYKYEKDNAARGKVYRSYSAGIISRATQPMYNATTSNDPYDNTNYLNLDTMSCSYNTFHGNEIDNFGYGIVAIGLGTLFNNSNGLHERRYDTNNVISSNKATNVARAGFFIGFEENAQLLNNYVYGAGSSTTDYAGGLLIGGETITDMLKYNNINTTIDGNEIGNINGSTYSYGIKVEQGSNTLQGSVVGPIKFPNVLEKTKVYNNLVWNLNAANRAGIILATCHDTNSKLSDTNYFTRYDKIYNNTVIIGEDGIPTTGTTIGALIANANYPEFYNNAIAIADTSIATGSLDACVYYQGFDPLSNSKTINNNYNAYYLGAPSAGCVFRFVEIDSNNSSVLNNGLVSDYRTLSQWKSWMRTESNSFYGNFVNNYVPVVNSYGFTYFRITNPAPKASILNDRGLSNSLYTKDVTGATRGDAGQSFDIGAIEFNGRYYSADVEASAITAPKAYKPGEGAYSEAEYVMTKEPIKVSALVTNNSFMPTSNLKATLTIERIANKNMIIDNQNQVVAETTTVYKNDQLLNINNGASVNFDFDLDSYKWQTYSDLLKIDAGYIADVNNNMRNMMENVTPVYKLTLSIPNDEDLTNNTVSKYVRFYLYRSTKGMMVSGENTYNVDLSTTDPLLIPAKLNYDSVIVGLNKINYINTSTQHMYDVLDRAGWSPRSIDYTNYRTMIWTDGYSAGDAQSLDRVQKTDITNFINSGSTSVRKNLLVASQEIARNTASNWLGSTFNVALNAGNPLGTGGPTYAGKGFRGVAIASNYSSTMKSTGVLNDVDPFPSSLTSYSTTAGVSNVAFAYNSPRLAKDSVMGISNVASNHITVLIGADWRHLPDCYNILRACRDFISLNNSDFVPVELVDFNASKRNSKVDLNWATSVENNFDKFVVERKSSNDDDFNAITNVQAIGNSDVRNDYSITDANVTKNTVYSYRLKLVNKDGSYNYSDIKTVEFDDFTANEVSEAYPNPSNGVFKFNFDGSASITVFDVMGNMIANNMPIQSGSSIDLSSFASGSYKAILTINGKTVVKTLQIVK